VVNNRFMYRNVSFDADRDFVPVIMVSRTPIVLVASHRTGLATLAQLIAKAKAEPGRLNLGSPGHGTVAHISAELLQRLAGRRVGPLRYPSQPRRIPHRTGNSRRCAFDVGSR